MSYMKIHCSQNIVPCFVGVILFGLIAVGYFIYSDFYTFSNDQDYILLNIKSDKILFTTDEKFLSVALDTSFMGCLFHKLTEGEWEKLQELSGLLSPAYLRLGGTQADQLLFKNLKDDVNTYKSQNYCNEIYSNDYLIINDEDWVQINTFANKAKLDFIMDLNVLLRSGVNWNSTNAQSLIKFSEEREFPLSFQLGNEPNSFPHVFNVFISGKQLAKDFLTLRQILNSSKNYKNSKLIGPDVTRPKQFQIPSLKYLQDFLSQPIVIDAVTWHHYYLNGRTATLEDFINPKVFDELRFQIKAVKNVVRNHSSTLPIWISETSSAYGGGAPKLSDTFVASFFWLDKLGEAAKSGISIVIRQSLFKDHYALISSSFEPLPDFWISFFYKNLVGNQTLNITVISNNETAEHLRFYAHCLSPKAPINGSVVVFGMNLFNKTEFMVASGINFAYPIYSFTFRAANKLNSREILLNEKLLVYDRNTVYHLLKTPNLVQLPLVIPSYSIVFWIFDEIKDSVCTNSRG